MKTRETGMQFGRFAVVGTVSTAINYLIFLLLTFAHLNYLLAATTGYLAGVLAGFSFNRAWTFASKGGRVSRQLPLYFIIYLASLGVSILFLKFLVETLFIKPLIANIGAIGLSTIMNFIGSKLLVFRHHQDE